MTKSYKVVGIGNAIIDILAYVDDEFLKKNNIKKGVMNLISSDRSKELLKKIKVSKKVAGGSAANTIVGLSQLGLDTSYIGKVNNDLLGEFFINELNKENIEMYIILPVPEMGWEIPNNLARQFFLKKKLSKDILSISKKSFDERNKKINFFFNSIEKNYNLNLISLEDLFCDDIRCYAHINNIPLYFDDDHMSMKGAELLSKKLSKYID